MSRSLGFVNMPDGYELVQVDSGHWLWVETATDRESVIDCDRWAIYRGAKQDAERKALDASSEAG
jgi:hypothetical protein